VRLGWGARDSLVLKDQQPRVYPDDDEGEEEGGTRHRTQKKQSKRVLLLMLISRNGTKTRSLTLRKQLPFQASLLGFRSKRMCDWWILERRCRRLECVETRSSWPALRPDKVERNSEREMVVKGQDSFFCVAMRRYDMGACVPRYFIVSAGCDLVPR